jgi:hypothetical protein
MKLNKDGLILLFGLIFCSIQMHGQSNPTGGGYLPDLTGAKFTLAVHEIHFEEMGTGGQRMNYEQIKGSPFWKDEYTIASLFTYDNLMLGKARVKMNFLTNEIYYLDNKDIELVIPNELISKLIIHPTGDTSKKLTLFRRSPSEFFVNEKPVEDYVQELNDGKLKLMKLTRRKVTSADSLFGTKKRYFFTTDEYYFVGYNKSIHQVKKLSKESVLNFVPAASGFDKWIAENKINFKKEEDIIRFFNHYNQQQQASKQSAQ